MGRYRDVLKGTRREYYYMDPEDLLLITDRNHSLYDPRVESPPDEYLVRNIMRFGVKNPIIARVNEDGTAEVVAGRRRVIASREANRRLVDAGLKALKVRVIPEKGLTGICTES